jgi:hypothetical protein
VAKKPKGPKIGEKPSTKGLFSGKASIKPGANWNKGKK